MSISGIVLITVCFANALTIQAHYCPCTYNNKFLISEKPSFLGVDNSYIPALNYYPNLHQSAFQQDLLNPFPQQFHKKIENPKISEITKSADQAKEEKTKIKDQSVANVKMQIGNMKTEQPKKNSIAAPKVAVGVMDGMKENKQIRTYAVEEKRNEGSKVMEQKVKSGSPIATPLLKPKSSEESANVLVTKNTHQATHQQMFQLFSPVFMEVKKPPQKQESTKTTDSEKHEEHHDAHHHDHDKNIHYKFEYSVNDEKTKDIKSQREERQGDVVRGEYSLRESDGNVRTVKYYADWKTGFHADVQNSKRRSLR